MELLFRLEKFLSQDGLDPGTATSVEIQTGRNQYLGEFLAGVGDIRMAT